MIELFHILLSLRNFNILNFCKQHVIIKYLCICRIMVVEIIRIVKPKFFYLVCCKPMPDSPLFMFQCCNICRLHF